MDRAGTIGRECRAARRCPTTVAHARRGTLATHTGANVDQSGRRVR